MEVSSSVEYLVDQEDGQDGGQEVDCSHNSCGGILFHTNVTKNECGVVPAVIL